ncbi:MAG: MBL fold metallo-hydrolase [Actinobacteria bacterium]|nr:MBL fold metallo-hydrolase [Actinomycetota bacterium]
MPTVHVLVPGYVGQRVASTVSLIEAEGALIIVDPGMVANREAILAPLRAMGHNPDMVTDVVISHHHPDHTMNIGLFPNASVHDHWAMYRDDIWESMDAEGRVLAPGVTLWETPGHTPQDITTVVDGDDGVVALTHLWWQSDKPVEDPYATDPEALHRGRSRVLGTASLIIPGHGAAFTPDSSTPR